MKTRIYFLDNLRTVLIFLVIVLHAGLVYEPVLKNTWIVWDPSQNNSIGLVRMYLDLFVMFVIFFISGYFVRTSLKSKTSLDFFISKFKRIMIPWLVAVFTLIPAYKIIFLYSRGLPQEEWYSYFHFFQRAGTDLSVFSNNPMQNWLWFLPALFIFQIAYLALSKTKLLSLRISLKTGVVLTFVLGLIYSMIISSTGLVGWFNSPALHFQRERILIYFIAFLLGTLCNKLQVFESSQKNKRLYIWSNVALTISLSVFTVVALNFFFNIIDPSRNYYFISETIDKILYYSSSLLSMLSFLYILIYVFRFSFNKSNQLMRHLNNFSYSVYIIHMIVLGVLAVILLYIPIPAIIKYLVLMVATFIVSNTIVYFYKRLFQQSVLLKTLALSASVVVLFFIIHNGAAENSSTLESQTMVSESNLTKPETGLHEAAIQGNLDVVIQHIRYGSVLDIKEPAGGSSPLILAAVFGNTEVAIALINAGANLNLTNNDGSTALHTAAFFCRTEIVEALLENGADKTLKNNSGSTALESVSFPFELLKPFYDHFSETLGPLGLTLDYEKIMKTRPIIAEMLI